MVRTKFTSLLRGLLQRMDRTASPAVPAARPVSASAPLPPPPSAVAPVPAAAADGGFAARAGEDEIVLPLAPVLAGLPMELRAKIVSVPPAGRTLHVPAETIVSQLAFGAVKISFGELRQLAAGVFANSGSELDEKPVSLPLNEILSRIKPSLLARRHGNRVEVSDEISGPFNNRCSGVVFTAHPLKAAPAPPAPASAPAPLEFTPNRMNPPAAPPAPGPIAFRPPPGAESLPKAAINGHRPAPLAPLAPPPPATAALAPMPAPAPAATRPEPTTPTAPTIFATLRDLAENWPEELKIEITRLSLGSVSVPLPGKVVEAGLKRGRVTMPWKELRMLAKPNSAASANDALELELPLKVIAPSFLAAKKNDPQARQAVEVSGEIPNLFFGFPQPAPVPVSAPPPASRRAPPPAPAPRVGENPAAKKNGESSIHLWGDPGEAQRPDESVYAPPPVPQTDFTSRRALPRDVVEQAVKLPGVAGALVTLPDGLRVASEVPPGLNPDTLAAFIPQIYERTNQSTRELRMGVLNHVSFTVGHVPWQIFRVNSVYFAVFGQAGLPLPAAELTQLAGELDRKKPH